jgi:hypothetical protein
MTAAFAISISGSRRIVLALIRFAFRWDFAFKTLTYNATAHIMWLRSEWRVRPELSGPVYQIPGLRFSFSSHPGCRRSAESLWEPQWPSRH